MEVLTLVLKLLSVASSQSELRWVSPLSEDEKELDVTVVVMLTFVAPLDGLTILGVKNTAALFVVN